MHCRAWTLLLTSPEPEHYKRILKESSSFRLYMEPCGQVSTHHHPVDYLLLHNDFILSLFHVAQHFAKACFDTAA
ncbi:hypothetical protein PCANC_13265 [Puccinia coronata f. sp. avenae]|uniref:Uncharacterized protein n=1 Tax=Puccinia coronata f. sp. avenae TaxID=200324 RepID=A0A2N5S9S8_9BASI|nr:hypothetical protein PCANC_21895 [Puccinia coronata f. sp. avenae]PLW23914.1 hypothetical protein PCANC_27877 [Puccinia coronata f. sp. avenae]PLW43555.1 hypothetical protein PCANC_13265 [Puccinia coronata f. sp. avenae]